VPNNISKIFTDIKQLQIFILGMYSGMPLFIIYTTLAAWMKQNAIDIEVITSFAAARMFYSAKVLWSPIVDHCKIPLLYNLGRRKSWIILMMSLISIIIFGYTYFEPTESIKTLFILTCILGALSATLDIAIDAYRIDNVSKDQLSMSAANVVFGYRIGGMISVTGAFFIADSYSWDLAFLLISGLYLVGCVFTMTLSDKHYAEAPTNSIWGKIKEATIDPFAEFITRPYSLIILSAIIFYKLGDAMLGVVATPFYIELGFTLKQIATIVKLYGVAATIFGSYLGGLLMYKYGNLKGLLICGIAQSVTNLAFVWLHHQGNDATALTIAISVENIASGMGDAALVGYLSYLCNKSFSATQYALLSSCSGLFSHSIVAYGGKLLKIIGWDYYFIMTSLLALPGLAVLTYLYYKKLK